MNTEAKIGGRMILGLGNPILGDDGIGCFVSELIGSRIPEDSGVTILSASVSPIRLLDEISGYERLVIIDSITTGRAEPGELLEIRFPRNGTLPVSAHHISIDQLLPAGNALGLSMPKYVKVYGIEIIRPEEYSDTLSPVLRKRLPEIAEEIIELEFINCNHTNPILPREEN